MDLRVNNVEPSLMAALKKRAIDAGKTLRQYVLDLLHEHVRSSK